MECETCCDIYGETADGKLFIWSVGAVFNKDDEKSLREHLKHWVPGSKFLGYRFGAGYEWKDAQSDFFSPRLLRRRGR